MKTKPQENSVKVGYIILVLHHATEKVKFVSFANDALTFFNFAVDDYKIARIFTLAPRDIQVVVNRIRRQIKENNEKGRQGVVIQPLKVFYKRRRSAVWLISRPEVFSKFTKFHPSMFIQKL